MHHWFGAAEQAIGAIFRLSPRPEAACCTVVRQLVQETLLRPNYAAAGVCPLALSRLCFVAGHVALKMLVYTEQLERRMKLTRAAAANAGGGSTAAANAGGGSTAANNQGGDGTDAASKTAGEKKAGGRGDDREGDAAEEDEMNAAAEVEAEDERRFGEVIEHEIVGRNLLGALGPLVARLVADERGVYGHPLLRESAVLALCKFMSVSGAFCERHLDLLFATLERAPEPAVRANIVVALGDLAFRFPNAVEPYNPRMYGRLRDGSAAVRANALMVLTHLVLNDMIKVKGHVSEIARCVCDDEPRIQGMAQLFFRELSKRGNSPIYNFIPDIVGHLSRGNTTADGSGSSGGSVTPEKFRAIMTFLLGFVEKDKHAEGLAEKLCVRIKAAEEGGSGTGGGGGGKDESGSAVEDGSGKDAGAGEDSGEGGSATRNSGGSATQSGGGASQSSGEGGLFGSFKDGSPGGGGAGYEQQQRDMAYCLTQLKLTDKLLKTLVALLPSYKAALRDDDVHKSFAGIAARAKKSTKAELKELGEELEKQVEIHHQGEAEEAGTSRRAQQAAAIAGKRAGAAKAAAAATPRRPPCASTTASTRKTGGKADGPKASSIGAGGGGRKEVALGAGDNDDDSNADEDAAMSPPPPCAAKSGGRGGAEATVKRGVLTAAKARANNNGSSGGTAAKKATGTSRAPRAAAASGGRKPAAGTSRGGGVHSNYFDGSSSDKEEEESGGGSAEAGSADERSTADSDDSSSSSDSEKENGGCNAGRGKKKGKKAAAGTDRASAAVAACRGPRGVAIEG
ncbi:unnamed protein product [Phaeothamnion confervicola]